MSTDPRVSDLLLRWEELCEEGRPAPLEELCRDCPDLLPELRRRVRGLLTLRGHAGAVVAVALLPDGDAVASADREGGHRLWRAPSWRRIEALRRSRRQGK
jgi:hypothetical protein